MYCTNSEIINPPAKNEGSPLSLTVKVYILRFVAIAARLNNTEEKMGTPISAPGVEWQDVAFFGLGKFDVEAGTKWRSTLTIANILGYFPLTGIISGVFHAVFGIAFCFDKDLHAAGRILIVRGILEILGVGCLCFPVDIVCTALRVMKSSKK